MKIGCLCYLEIRRQILLMLQVLLFHRCIAETRIHWKVLERIEHFGDNLVLICAIDKKMQHLRDTMRWYKEQRLITFNNKSDDNTKYKAQIVPGGVQLTILHCSSGDINKTYHCIIGFHKSKKEILSAQMIFRDTNVSENTQQLDKRSIVFISSIIGGLVSLLILCTGFFCLYKWCNKQGIAIDVFDRENANDYTNAKLELCEIDSGVGISLYPEKNGSEINQDHPQSNTEDDQTDPAEQTSLLLKTIDSESNHDEFQIRI